MIGGDNRLGRRRQRRDRFLRQRTEGEPHSNPKAGAKPGLEKHRRAFDLINWSKPLPDLWEQFERLTSMPLMVIRGENSRLLTPETVEAMRRLHPIMRLETIIGQGHPPLLDTEGLPEKVAAFFDVARGN